MTRHARSTFSAATTSGVKSKTVSPGGHERYGSTVVAHISPVLHADPGVTDPLTAEASAFGAAPDVWPPLPISGCRSFEFNPGEATTSIGVRPPWRQRHPRLQR